MAFNESVYREYINSLYSETTPEKTTQLYTKFVKQYDDIMDFESFAYLGDRIAVEAFVELGLDKSIRILDVAAGQGRVAKLLRSNGYENVDALDGSIEMLEVAQSQRIYQNYFHCVIDKDTVLPFGDNTYDAAIAAGCMGMAHVCIEVVGELVRITKSGKYWLLLIVRQWGLSFVVNFVILILIIYVKIGGVVTWAQEDPKFCYGEDYFNDCIKYLCDSGKCQMKSGYPKKDSRSIYMGKEGFFYVIEVL